MRAVRLENQTIKLAQVADPVAGPDETLVRPLLGAISSIDRQLAANGAGRGPITLGHEFVGTVVETGPTVDKRKLKGKRVVGSLNLSCGKCDLCRGGLSNHCKSRAIVGAVNRDGCFADLLTLPLSAVHLVPEAIDNAAAVFANLIAAAAHASQMLRVEGKPYITILGDGPLGLLTAQVMSRLNASVRLLGKHAEKFSLCERWGVKHRLVSEVGRRGDQDVVVDCTGSPSGLELAMQLVRPRGKIILKSTATRLPALEGAVLHPGPPIDLSPLVVHEIDLLGCRCGSIDHALRILERREIDTTTLVTARVKLDQLPGNLKAPRVGLKTLVEY